MVNIAARSGRLKVIEVKAASEWTSYSSGNRPTGQWRNEWKTSNDF